MGRPAAASRGLSRRRFVALLAAGALANAAPVPAAPAPAAPRKRRPAARSVAIEKGIAQQKAFLAKQLETLRAYPLPPGSDPAFVFRPMSPRRIR